MNGMTEATPAPASTAPAETAAPAATAVPAAPAAPAAPEWMAALPDDLRGDATLLRYQSIDDLARGHIEAHKLAKSKAVPLPGDTDESRKAFADALRPQSADAYDFGDLPDGIDKGLIDGFREFAFNSGLPPHMAKDALDFYTGAMQAQIEEANRASLADVDAFAKEYGPQYQGKLAAVQAMLESFTGTPLEIGEAELNRFDIKMGSSNLMKFMFALHDRIGDLAPAGGNEVPTGMTRIAPENAESTLDMKMSDPAWRAQAKIAGTAEARESDQLQRLVAQHRVSQGRG
jgi:hypothetical protein